MHLKPDVKSHFADDKQSNRACNVERTVAEAFTEDLDARRLLWPITKARYKGNAKHESKAYAEESDLTPGLHHRLPSHCHPDLRVPCLYHAWPLQHHRSLGRSHLPCKDRHSKWSLESLESCMPLQHVTAFQHVRQC